MKYNMVIPLNGKGQRMIDGGYTTPKPILKAGHKTILEWGIDSIDTSQCKMHFITRRDQPEVRDFIRNKWPEANVLVAERDGKGSLSDVVLVAGPWIDNDTPLIVFNPDVAFDKFTPQDHHFEDGTILTFKSNSPLYSYAREENGLIVETAEKQAISEHATVGLYCFRSGAWLMAYAKHSVPLANGEHYVAPIYNQLINMAHAKIKKYGVQKMYVMGTPAEYEFFCRHIYPTTQSRPFILCSDHSGFEQKQLIKDVLHEMKLTHGDVGCFTIKDCDYAEYIKKAVQHIPEGFFGIACCRSGQGVNICANKSDKEAVCCVIHSPGNYIEDTRLAIEHNCANFLALGSRCYFSKEDIKEIIQTIRSSSFDGGRHQVRMMKSLGYIK